MTEISENNIRVVAAIADKAKVILYKEDGDTLTVSQGDYRLQALMDEIIPITARGEVAVISLTKFSVYADFQEQSKGVVRFYKANRRALGSLGKPVDPNSEVVIINMEFAPDISPEQITSLMDQVQEQVAPWMNQTSKPVKATISTAVTKAGETIKETVTTDFSPITSEDNESDINIDETIVAVIDGMVIPDIAKLRPYIMHAVKNNSVTAVEAFLKRIAAMNKKRAHSTMELMQFLQSADLPLAEDGSIIAYKVLNKRDGGKFADPHTGKVMQRVGSRVSMDEKLIDPSRRTQCSTGLHVARRAYLRGFRASDAFLIKIAPEDIVAVPEHAPDKMRVAAYHIIGHLPAQAYDLLKSNKSMTSDKTTSMILERAIVGDHVGVTEEVKIGGAYGTDIEVVQKGGKKQVRDKSTSSKGATTLDDSKVAAKVEPREINKRVTAEIAKNQPAETKAQRDARKKREKRAAEKLAKETVALPKKPAAKVAKTKAPKASKKASKPKNDNTVGLTADQKRVLDLHAHGKGQSEISKKTGISRRTIGRWIDKYGTKSAA